MRIKFIKKILQSKLEICYLQIMKQKKECFYLINFIIYICYLCSQMLKKL